MNAEILKNRTKKLAIDIALFCRIIYPDPLLKAYANQLIRCSSDSEKSVKPIWNEANEILSIVVASLSTARRNQQSKKS